MASRRKPGEHEFVDDAFRKDGRSWQHGVRFVCIHCGLERRKVEEGQDRYYLRGQRVKERIVCLQ